LLAGLALHSVAIERGRAALARQPDAPPSAVVNAYPTIGTIFVWRVTGETPAGWYVGRTHLLFNGPLEMTFYPNDSGPLVRQALADDRVQVFRCFSNDQLRPILGRRDGRAIVDLHDMRYGRDVDSGTSFWFARVTFDTPATIGDQGQPQVVSVERGSDRPRDGRTLGKMAQQAWKNLTEP
jgi:hypothetical protein